MIQFTKPRGSHPFERVVTCWSCRLGMIQLQEWKMVGNILGWLAFVILAVLFGWLALRLWRVKNAILK